MNQTSERCKRYMARYRYEMIDFGNYYYENLIIEGFFINIDINGKGPFWCSKI